MIGILPFSVSEPSTSTAQSNRLYPRRLCSIYPAHDCWCSGHDLSPLPAPAIGSEPVNECRFTDPPLLDSQTERRGYLDRADFQHCRFDPALFWPDRQFSLTFHAV